MNFKKKILFSTALLAVFACSVACASKAPTPFEATTAQLQSGGDCYQYESGKRICEKLDSIQAIADALAEFDGEFGKFMKQFSSKVMPIVLNDSGIRAVQGFGLSSIKNSDELHSGRFVYYCPDARKKGFVWNYAGREDHKFEVLKMIPASAAAFMTADFDFAGFYKFLKNSFEKNGDKKFLAQLQDFEKMAFSSGVDIVKQLDSLDGNVTMIFGENKSSSSFLPFALTYMLKTKDDSLFKLIASKLQAKGMKVTDGKIFFPLPVNLFLEQKRGYLILRLGDAVDPLDVLAGKVENITTDSEFIRYSRNLPLNGVACLYYSEKYTKLMEAFAAKSGSPVKLDGYEDMFSMQMFCVTSSTNEGFVSRSNSKRSLIPNYFAYVPYIIKTVKTGNFLNLGKKGQSSAVPQKTLGSQSNLKQIAVGLLLYASDNKNFYPEEFGAKGLNKIYGKYIPAISVFYNSNEKKATGILEENKLAYVYLGGKIDTAKIKNLATVLIAFEKPSTGKTVLPALFADGHVELLKDSFKNCKEVAESVIKKYSLKGTDASLLRERCSKADAALKY